jgi:Flp pilus assembly protein TadD
MYYPAMKIAHRDFCLVSLLRGHPLRALAEMFMVIGLGEPIPLNDQERAELTGRAAKIHNREGIAAARKLQWDTAIAEFQYALDYAPDNGNIERSLAFSFASKGDFDKAETAYTKSFGEDPSDGYSHADFAFLLADSGKSDRAMAQLSEAVKLEPKDAALHVDMGWMAESKSDFSTAADEFKQAVALSPKHAGLWAHLGRLQERLGKNAGAKEDYEKALAIDPSLDETKQRLEDLKSSPAPDLPGKDDKGEEERPSDANDKAVPEDAGAKS